MGYQDKSEGKVYPIVYAVTKVCIQWRDLPVLLVMNYATFFDDTDETESLFLTFEIIKHGKS